MSTDLDYETLYACQIFFQEYVSFYNVFVVVLQYQILYIKTLFLAIGNSPSDDVKLLFIDDIVYVMLYFSINVKVIYQFSRM